MTVEQDVLKYITNNPFNNIYRYIQGIDTKIICLNLKITVQDFENALLTLEGQGIITKVKVFSAGGKVLNTHVDYYGYK